MAQLRAMATTALFTRVAGQGHVQWPPVRPWVICFTELPFPYLLNGISNLYSAQLTVSIE